MEKLLEQMAVPLIDLESVALTHKNEKNKSKRIHKDEISTGGINDDYPKGGYGSNRFT